MLSVIVTVIRRSILQKMQKFTQLQFKKCSRHCFSFQVNLEDSLVLLSSFASNKLERLLQEKMFSLFYVGCKCLKGHLHYNIVIWQTAFCHSVKLYLLSSNIFCNIYRLYGAPIS
jgi:hypothetical protein